MLESIPSRLYSEWMAFERLEPFGERLLSVLAGLIASTVANANRDPKKKREPFTLNDFRPKFDERPEEPDEEDDEVDAEVEKRENLGKRVLAWAMAMKGRQNSGTGKTST